MFIDDKEKTRRLSRWILVMVLACSLIVLGIAHVEKVMAALGYLYRLIQPLLTGFLIAYVMNVPYSFFSRCLFARAKKPLLHKLRKPLALVIAFVLVVAIVAGVIALVIPEFIRLGAYIVDGVSKLIQMIQDAQAGHENFFTRFNINWEQIQSTVETWVSDRSGKLITGAASAFGSAAGGLIDLVFAVIFAVYMLASKDRLLRQIRRLLHAWLPEKRVKQALHVGDVMNGAFRAFIVGQVVEAVILGVLCALGMLFLALPNVLMISLLMGICALIPIVGAYVSGIIGTLLILIVDPTKALIFLIYLIVLQQLEGNLIYPRVVGGKLHLPGIWVLAAVTIGGSLAGPFGMLVGVPVAAGLYTLLREWTKNKEEKKLQAV